MAALSLAMPAHIQAQRAGDGQAPGPTAPKASAPIDLTGYWVSVVTEDWRYRMLTAAKGDYASLPLNEAGRKAADTWDPARDQASGNQCKAYGAANIMRMPGRLHITWDADNTLKIETDAGEQTRLLRFGTSRAPSGAAGWQGHSTAIWEMAGPQRGGGGGRGGGGSLKVVTTHMKPGYLRRNGVPYSENALVTEYFDRHNEPNGDQWFTVTTIVEDPKYLDQPFITSTHFKRESDGAMWHPAPCAAG